jgi:hypothetical protein
MPRKTRRMLIVNARIVGQHFFRDFLCFEYFLNLHMLVDEWNQELHFALILGILFSELNH